MGSGDHGVRADVRADVLGSVWDGVVGQERAVRRLASCVADPVHAYLFVGPPGSTKDEASRAFAAALLAGGDHPEHRSARLALAGEHPDVREVRRVGAAIAREQIEDIIRTASLAPIESDRKIMILEEFHLLTAEGAARLLKTLEEPPASTVFIVLADQVDSELVTIASRCVRIEFSPIPADAITAALVSEGHDPGASASASAASAGNLDRARVLVSDPGLAARREAFAAMPRRLDGTGSPSSPSSRRSPSSPTTPPHRSRRSMRRRSPNWRPGSPRPASVGAAGKRSRTSTSARCVATAPTSCAAPWR